MKVHQHMARSLGQKRLADALGVGLTAVNNALKREHFPATWYPVIRELCAADGIDCPEKAFNFKVAPRDAATSRGTPPKETAA